MRPWYADSAWLAVRDADSRDLMDLLRLVDPVPMTWAEVVPHKQTLRERLSRAERRHALNRLVFVSAPVEGWRFLVGKRFHVADPEEAASCGMDPYPAVAACCARASERFGEACLFTSSWDNGDYAWVLARAGRIYREFVLIGGEVVADEGEPTAAERRLLAFWEATAPEENDCFQHPEDVATIAAESSIHPAALVGCYDKGLLTRWQREPSR